MHFKYQVEHRMLDQQNNLMLRCAVKQAPYAVCIVKFSKQFKSVELNNTEPQTWSASINIIFYNKWDLKLSRYL